MKIRHFCQRLPSFNSLKRTFHTKPLALGILAMLPF